MLTAQNGLKGKGKAPEKDERDVVPSTEGLLHSVGSAGSTVRRRSRGEEGARDDAEGSSSSEEDGDEEEEDNSEADERETEIEAEEGEERIPLQGPVAPPDPPDGPDDVEEDEVGEGDSAGEEDASEDADESGSDDDEDDEPTLKYARLGGGTLELFAKDTASAVAVCSKYIVRRICARRLPRSALLNSSVVQILGTHNGAIFVLTPEGQFVKRYRPHSAMVNGLSVDSTCEFVASASMDGSFASLLSCCAPLTVLHSGRVAIQSLTTPEAHIFDMQRPMRCVALEPLYGKRNTRQFVSGGMAGTLVLSEKGWLGQKDVTLFSGEGPIWAVEWRGTFIAWASDAVRLPLVHLKSESDAPETGHSDIRHGNWSAHHLH